MIFRISLWQENSQFPYHGSISSCYCAVALSHLCECGNRAFFRWSVQGPFFICAKMLRMNAEMNGESGRVSGRGRVWELPPLTNEWEGSEWEVRKATHRIHPSNGVSTSQFLVGIRRVDGAGEVHKMHTCAGNWQMSIIFNPKEWHTKLVHSMYCE